jgi:hypothetical protein
LLAQSLALLPAESFAAHQETSDAPPARPEMPQPPGGEPRGVRQATEPPVSVAEPLDEEPPELRRRARELAVGAVMAESKVAAAEPAERSGLPGVLAQQAALQAAVKRAEGQDELAAAPSGDSSAAAWLAMVRMERLPLLAALAVAPAP